MDGVIDGVGDYASEYFPKGARKRTKRKKGGKVRCTEKWCSAGGERDTADA